MDTTLPHRYTTADMASQRKPRAVQTVFGDGNLFTPPENMMDSFSQEDNSKAGTVKKHAGSLPPIQSHTPPTSPEDTILPGIAAATGYTAHDPVLFPADSQSERARSPSPLFGHERDGSPRPRTASDDRAQSVSSIPESNVRDAATPLPGRMLFPWSGINTGPQARQYYLDRCAELQKYKSAWRRRDSGLLLPSPRATSPGHDFVTGNQLARLSRTNKSGGIEKPRPTVKTTKAAARTKPAKAASPIKTEPARRRTPKARTPATHSDFMDNAFPQTSTKHKRAPPSKKIEGDGLKWTEMEDYSPPTTNLDSNPKALRATWRGNPLDLSDDPDKSQLHAQEIAVAAELRLTCAQYLACKRKIFQARLQSIKDQKNFTKTAAQGACNIDVNKASQLWEAYDKVGWFKETWYQQWLT